MTTVTKTDQTEQTRLISLDVENVMQVRAVYLEFDPKGGLTIIGGDNGAGKTSTLKALEFCLAGGRSICEEPLRKGTRKGHVIVKTNDMTVTRTFTAKGTSIKVEAKDGTVFASPQAMLDKLIGQLAFNPLAFLDCTPAKQAETLRELLGLDFTDLDAKHATIYSDRRDVGRDRDALQGQLTGMTHDADAPKEEVSISELIAERERRAEINKGNQYAAKDLSDLNHDLQGSRAELTRERKGVENIQASLGVARSHVKAAEGRCDELAKRQGELAKKIEALVDEDVDAIDTQLSLADTTNRAVRANAQWKTTETAHDLKTRAYNVLSHQIDQIVQEKADVLAAAKFPIEGLTFSAEGVELNGLPFNQAGDAEQLQVSVAMGLAMNKGLKLLLIDGGERLDGKGIEIIERMARESGAYVLMSRVSTGKECAVIIKDGMLIDGKE